MSILSGFIKERKYKKQTDGFKLVSQDTQSETVFMANGVTLEATMDGKSIKVLTQSTYDALETKDENTLYFTT